MDEDMEASGSGTSGSLNNSNAFVCKLCSKIFKTAFNLKRHLKEVRHDNKCLVCDLIFKSAVKLKSHNIRTHRTLKCKICEKSFKFIHSLKRHEGGCVKARDMKLAEADANNVTKNNKTAPVFRANENETINCHICEVDMPRKYYPHHLRSYEHIEKASRPFSDDCRVCLYQSALEAKILTYSIRNISLGGESEEILDGIDLKSFMEREATSVSKLIQFELQSKKNVKFRIYSCGLYSKENIENGAVVEVEQRKFFYSTFREVNLGTDYLPELIEESIREVLEQAADFCAKESGWTIVKILRLCVEIVKVQQFRGSSYLKLPKRLEAIKGATTNIHNVDDKCFLFCCLAHKFSNFIDERDRRKPAAYEKYLNYYKVDGLSWPLSIQGIRQFEVLNAAEDISFSIFTLVSRSNNISSPIYRSKHITSNHCMLLLIQNLDHNQLHISHYVLINDLAALLRSQVSRYHSGRQHFCIQCLSSFISHEALERHIEIGCVNIRYKIPDELEVKFKKHSALAMADFCIYLDTETNIQPLQATSTENLDENVSWTNYKQKHVAASVAYSFQLAEGVQDTYLEPLRMASGDDCIEAILDILIADVKHVYDKHLNVIVPMKLTNADMTKMALQKNCGICLKPLLDNERVVIDHNHANGQVRNFKCHSHCNIALYRTKVIYVVAHSLSSFDGHLLILGLAKKKLRLKVIAKSKEIYISFSTFVPVGVRRNKKNTESTVYVEVRFIDSYRFLSASLSKLVMELDELPYYERFIKDTFRDENALSYVKKNKFFYPYEWQTSNECLLEKELPPIDAFFSSLTNSTISQDDYDYCLDIYTRLKTIHGSAMNMKIFSQFYLTTDVLLLKDLFTAFRVNSMTTFRLDPLHFYSLPSYAFEVLKLHMEGEGYTISVLPDPTMSQWCRKNLKGGLSCAMKRSGTSNTEHQRDFDSSKPRTSIHNLDINGMYSSVMLGALPYDSFEWLTGDEFNECANTLVDYEKSCAMFSNDSEFGVFYEADVDVPQHLHSYYNSLPLLPENLVVGNTQTKKLIPNLYNKKAYVAHALLFQHAQKHGLIVKNVTKILRFRQKKHFCSFMELCTDLKVNATSSFARTLWKLIMNCVYGMTLKRANDLEIKLVTEWIIDGLRGNFNYAQKYLKSPLFKSFSIFNSTFVALEMQKTEVVLNNFTAIGMAVLDLSKIVL